VKVGVFAIGAGATAEPETIKSIATTSERLGFATVWAPEHIVFIDDYASRYPYAPAGKAPVRTDVPLLNPFIALAWAAACTSTIRLGTGIALVPEYHPLLLGKIVASVDYLSGGRMLLGIGIGWLEEEFNALGIPWARRAARTREYIEAMKRLWREERSDFSGEFVNFQKVRSFPKPVRGGRIPIIVGGQTEAALKRTAAYGDGWFGFNLTADETAATVKRLGELMALNGRKPSELELIVAPPAGPLAADDLKRYRDAGVHEIVPLVTFAASEPRAMLKALEDAARNLVEPAARL
jgi:probable F420-dependent oxidoreductase